MMRRLRAASLLCCVLAAAQGMAAAEKTAVHQFGVIGHVLGDGGGEPQLEQAIASTGEASLAFVVATGIKSESEPCTDTLYAARRELFDHSKRPMIVVPAASDWTGCKNSAGRSAAVERLNRLREVLYTEQASLGKRAIPVVRLSASSKFRSYAENAHWVVGNVLYATVNIAANNNHNRPEAGRNSEFEDRAVANRFWLNRLFALAQRQNLAAVVLFSEGDMKALSQRTGLMALLGRGDSRQDGFAPARRQVNLLAQKFDGKVLLIDAGPLAGQEPAIEWRGNLGHLSVGTAAIQVKVKPDGDTMFTLEKP
jgi:hypothetical protein